MRILETLSLLSTLFIGSVQADSFSQGVAAYYRGEYSRAIELLEKFERKSTEKTQKFKISVEKREDIETGVREITRSYFENWRAYAGSLFAIEQARRGCSAIVRSQAPIQVSSKLNGSHKKNLFSPREGDYWPESVMTMRTWFELFECRLPPK